MESIVEYVSCGECGALFAQKNRKSLLEHKAKCTGDPTNAQCDLIACTREDYMKVLRMAGKEKAEADEDYQSKTSDNANVTTEVKPRESQRLRMKKAKTSEEMLSIESPGRDHEYGLSAAAKDRNKDEDLEKESAAVDIDLEKQTDNTKADPNVADKGAFSRRKLKRRRPMRREVSDTFCWKEENMIEKGKKTIKAERDIDLDKGSLESREDASKQRESQGDLGEQEANKATDKAKDNDDKATDNDDKATDKATDKAKDNDDKATDKATDKAIDNGDKAADSECTCVSLSPGGVSRVSKRLQEKHKLPDGIKQTDEPPQAKKSKQLNLKQFLDTLDEKEYRSVEVKGVTRFKFLCQECDFTTMAMRNYYQHRQWHEESDEAAKLDPEEYEDVEEKPGQRRRHYKCLICQYRTKFYGMFKRHKTSHNDGALYKCEECNVEFLFQRQYKIHMGKHNRFPCSICGHTYSRRHDLDRHIKNVHNTPDPAEHLICSMCGYTCIYKHMMKDHMRKHTGEKFACEVEGCDFTTIYHRALKQHVASRHDEPEKYVCTMCGYKTNDKGMYVRHQKTHSLDKPHKCTLCDYRGPDMSYVRAHMKMHSTERNYCCDQCDYKTNRPGSLRIHMLSKHIGINPWQCNQCCYGAVTRSKVNDHIKSRHNGQGEVERKNVVVKFNFKAFKSDESSVGENDQVAKYTVFEQQPVSGSVEGISWSNLVGEEVSIENENPGDEDELCMYQCAFCEFSDGSMDVVQAHISDMHPEMEPEEQASEVIPEVQIVTEEGSSALEGGMIQNLEIVTEDSGGQYQLMDVGDGDSPVVVIISNPHDTDTDNIMIQPEIQNVIMEETEQPIEIVYKSEDGVEEEPRPDILQDEAVSTAVESILNLQDAS